MEVGPAFHRVTHHLNHASTACQGKNLADCLLGSMQLTRHTHTRVRAHMHTYVHARAACPLNDTVCTVRGTGVQRMRNEGSQRRLPERGEKEWIVMLDESRISLKCPLDSGDLIFVNLVTKLSF